MIEHKDIDGNVINIGDRVLFLLKGDNFFHRGIVNKITAKRVCINRAYRASNGVWLYMEDLDYEISGDYIFPGSKLSYISPKHIYKIVK